MKTKKKDKRNKAEKANKMDIKKMTALAMFSVIALTIFTAESMIGPIVPIPGIKLGLANIVTLLVLVLYGPKEALFVLIVRILLGSMFGGQMVSFFYSLFICRFIPYEPTVACCISSFSCEAWSFTKCI